MRIERNEGHGGLGALVAHFRTLLLRAERGLARGETSRGGAQPHLQPDRSVILVVDDDKDFLRFAQAVGASQLIDVLTADDVGEALEIAHTTPLSGAIIDIHLRGATGFELARELRNIERLESMPFAFVSASTSVATRAEAAHAGGVAFLAKPTSEERFSAAARRLIEAGTESEARALVLDQNEERTEEIARILKAEGIQVRVIGDPGALLQELEDFAPHVLLTAADLPNLPGTDVCRATRTSSAFATLPVILIADDASVPFRVELFRAGADDFVTRPFVPEELAARVMRRIERTQLDQRFSRKDPITGLLLRAAMAETLDTRMREAERTGRALTLSLMDLDHFKSVNDTYGHLSGDRVLRGFGGLLRRSFRAYDLRSRWGGEEFLVALPDVGVELATHIIEKIRRQLAAMAFSSDDGEEFVVTFTAGVAEYPADGADLRSLLAVADKRLYAGKHAGRDRTVFCDEPNPSEDPT